MQNEKRVVVEFVFTEDSEGLLDLNRVFVAQTDLGPEQHAALGDLFAQTDRWAGIQDVLSGGDLYEAE